MAVNAWVFSGGVYKTDDVNLTGRSEADITVGVDYGIAHCLQAGVVPDVLIGDFDSVDDTVLQDPRLLDARTIRHPVRKDRSDLELALDWLAKQAVHKVTLLGISGGRTDHHLFNWMLPFQKSWPFIIELIDATVHAHLVSVEYPLTVPVRLGQTISILPMPEATGVTTSGLEYALDDAFLSQGSTLGLSNVAEADTISVSLLTGRLLVFRVKSSSPVT